MTLQLVFKSILNRRFTALLTVISIALSVSLLLSVERIRIGTKEGFTNTVSNTDLIVGSKGSSINLLLYTIFHLGSPVETIPWSAYQDIASQKDIDWTIPISLGDSHKGHRVVGTDQNFFQHYRFSGGRQLDFATGEPFQKDLEVVIGAELARKLDYSVNTLLTLSHGAGSDISFQNHDAHKFRVSGVLEATGTPIDRSLYISLAAMELIHDEAIYEDRFKGDGSTNERADISAFLLKTKSRIGTLPLQRWINEYNDAPLTAIIPALTLTELWQGMSYIEGSLGIISVLVVVIGLIGMLIAIYNSLNERRREIAILRSLGASPGQVFVALISEAVILAGLGIITAVALTQSLMWLSKDWLMNEFSVNLDLPFLTMAELVYLAVVLGLAALLGAIPALRAYKQTLSDGLTIKI